MFGTALMLNANLGQNLERLGVNMARWASPRRNGYPAIPKLVVNNSFCHL